MFHHAIPLSLYLFSIFLYLVASKDTILFLFKENRNELSLRLQDGKLVLVASNLNITSPIPIDLNIVYVDIHSLDDLLIHLISFIR